MYEYMYVSGSKRFARLSDT